MTGGLQAGLNTEKHWAKSKELCTFPRWVALGTSYPCGVSSLQPNTALAPAQRRLVQLTLRCRANRMRSPAAAERHTAADRLKGDTIACAISAHPDLGTETAQEAPTIYPPFAGNQMQAALATNALVCPPSSPARTATLAL